MLQPRPWVTLLTGILAMVSLGSLHAFSVFLLPLEVLFQAQRGAVSLIYSLALISVTVLVLVGHWIYLRLSPPTLLAGAVLMAAAGLVITSQSSALIGVYAGYGVIFGAANGLGYGFTLQLVAQALPKMRGLAMGIVTGAYAIGAVIFAKVFSLFLASYSVAETMMSMAGFLIAIALVVWCALKISRAAYVSEPVSGMEPANADATVFKMWMGYGCGSAAGLMAIGHATGIVVDVGGKGSMLVLGAMVIGLGNGIAGFIAGYLADRISLRLLLIGLPLLSVGGLCMLLVVSDPNIAIGVLAIIGFAYGAIIAVYPAAVTAHYGVARSAKIYGQVFTSWGAAGLLGPWVAGAMYDVSGTYTAALGLAALAGVMSACFAFSLPRLASPLSG